MDPIDDFGDLLIEGVADALEAAEDLFGTFFE